MRHGASPDWSTGLAGGPASGLISTHLVTLICCLQVSALQRKPPISLDHRVGIDTDSNLLRANTDINRGFSSVPVN